MRKHEAFSFANAMRRRLPALVVSCGVLILAGTSVSAQAPPADTLQSRLAAVAANAAAERVEPELIVALDTMGAYLASLESFGLVSTFGTEVVLDNAQNVEIGGTASYVVRRPDRLRVNLVSDFGEREFIYDGETLYVVSPRENVFGEVGVGPTIKEMLETVAYHLGIEVPMADLFDWGTEDAPIDAVLEGFLVGNAQLEGVTTKHWAFRTANKDFQIWIQDGEQPLPRRIVIEDNAQFGRPAFQADLTWNLEQPIADDDFTFTPPDGASFINFFDLNEQAGGTSP